MSPDGDSSDKGDDALSHSLHDDTEFQNSKSFLMEIDRRWRWSTPVTTDIFLSKNILRNCTIQRGNQPENAMLVSKCLIIISRLGAAWLMIWFKDKFIWFRKGILDVQYLHL